MDTFCLSIYDGEDITQRVGTGDEVDAWAFETMQDATTRNIALEVAIFRLVPEKPMHSDMRSVKWGWVRVRLYEDIRKVFTEGAPAHFDAMSRCGREDLPF